MKAKRGLRTRVGRMLLALMAVVASAGQPASCASQSAATLLIQIQPEASIKVGSTPSWTTSGEIQSASVSLEVMMRLNNGATAELSIAALSDPLSATSGLQVETAVGTRPITESPVIIWSYSRSGRYEDPVILKWQLPAGSEPQSLPLVLKLTTSDGTAMASQILNLTQTAPPAQ
ncbi:MAG: hypothetical protein HY651_13105 [Acidobacteria bacterium]|nr:hypothetical protein [Acidobacteriota bacterium]